MVAVSCSLAEPWKKEKPWDATAWFQKLVGYSSYKKNNCREKSKLGTWVVSGLWYWNWNINGITNANRNSDKNKYFFLKLCTVGVLKLLINFPFFSWFASSLVLVISYKLNPLFIWNGTIFLFNMFFKGWFSEAQMELGNLIPTNNKFQCKVPLYAFEAFPFALHFGGGKSIKNCRSF